MAKQLTTSVVGAAVQGRCFWRGNPVPSLAGWTSFIRPHFNTTSSAQSLEAYPCCASYCKGQGWRVGVLVMGVMEEGRLSGLVATGEASGSTTSRHVCTEAGGCASVKGHVEVNHHTEEAVYTREHMSMASDASKWLPTASSAVSRVPRLACLGSLVWRASFNFTGTCQTCFPSALTRHRSLPVSSRWQYSVPCHCRS